ncbi:ATP-binding protein [Sphingosinicella sp. LY1275]|uniref:PAS domain-containing sensor histidine kinase n=1 Tax=Sphingosinicella sp. LY1275 TaxID=3095379 RepID=UPI002ADEBC0C|nr:ATP-binding protein [Sphingosinicella sp. LY1275]MEA1013531.1 ATP-binding protein [Sphingosinicella sp. LY1275]
MTSSADPDQLLSAVLDTALDAVVVMRHDGTVAAWNKLAERTFGWTAAEALNRRMSELIMPASERRRHDIGLERFLNIGEVSILGRRVELTALRKSGEEFPIELSVMLTNRFHEKLFLGFVRDITVRKEAEAEIARLQSELIHVSRVSAMGTMAATLAHELNQPLTAISNYLSACGTALRKGPLDSETFGPVLDGARLNAMRAGEIIRRLRTMTVRGETQRTIVDAAEVIDEAAALALVGAADRDVEAVIHHAPRLCVSADRIQLEQVILNLVRNGIEAMEGESCKTLRISGSRHGSHIRIIVSDTGPGLSEAARDALFEPFRSTKDSGMGVGLSICRTIVESHGGRIWAEDNADGGTCFVVELPAVPL